MATGFFDGASRGNPGHAGAGALIMDEQGKTVWEYTSYLGTRTNNEAEYSALIGLLHGAAELGIKKIEIRGDSKLVIEQVCKRWKINLPHLRTLASEAWELMNGIDVTLKWIPREKNKDADKLSNRAIDERK